MRTLGKLAVGRKVLVVTLALAVGFAIAGPASAGVVQNSPADKQYGKEPPAAANPTPVANPTPDVEPQAEGEIFLSPTVASAGQDEADSGGLLPFTGATLIVPSVLGGLLLAGGLFLVYRTRRREEIREEV